MQALRKKGKSSPLSTRKPNPKGVIRRSSSSESKEEDEYSSITDLDPSRGPRSVVSEKTPGTDETTPLAETPPSLSELSGDENQTPLPGLEGESISLDNPEPDSRDSGPVKLRQLIALRRGSERRDSTLLLRLSSDDDGGLGSSLDGEVILNGVQSLVKAGVVKQRPIIDSFFSDAGFTEERTSAVSKILGHVGLIGDTGLDHLCNKDLVSDEDLICDLGMSVREVGLFREASAKRNATAGRRKLKRAAKKTIIARRMFALAGGSRTSQNIVEEEEEEAGASLRGLIESKQAAPQRLGTSGLTRRRAVF